MRRICALAVALTILPFAAAAEPPTTAEAERHKDEAFRLFAAGEYAKGIEEMESAYRLVPHPGFLLNIAVAYDQWGGHCEDSLATLDRFFESCESCELRRAGEERAEQVRERCMARLRIDSKPRGAEVLLNGDHVGKTPLSLPVRPGAHEIEGRLDGHVTAKRSITLEAAQSRRVSMSLEPRAVASASEPAVAAAPEPTPEIPQLRTQPSDPSVAVAPLPEHEGLDLEPYAWTSFAVGAAGVITGTVFTVSTLSALQEEEEARRARRPREEIQELQHDASQRAVVANVGFVVGVVGGATGLLLLLLDEDEDDGLVVLPSASGVQVRF